MEKSKGIYQMMDPINNHEYKAGNVDWCAASYTNFRAIQTDKPECLPEGFKYFPQGPPVEAAGKGMTLKQDPVTKEYTPVDINKCAGFPIKGNGEKPDTAPKYQDEIPSFHRMLLEKKKSIAHSHKKYRRRNLQEFADDPNGGHQGGFEMFRHKKTPQLSYHRAVLEATKQQMGSMKNHMFDGTGRLLADMPDPTKCGAATTTSQKLACVGVNMQKSPEELPNSNHCPTSQGEMIPRDEDISYLGFDRSYLVNFYFKLFLNFIGVTDYVIFYVLNYNFLTVIFNNTQNFVNNDLIIMYFLQLRSSPTYVRENA